MAQSKLNEAETNLEWYVFKNIILFSHMSPFRREKMRIKIL